MLQSIRKVIFKGVAAGTALAIAGTFPTMNVFATNVDSGASTQNEGGVSSFLSVLGNSYDKKTVDSDIMGLVVERAAELDIAFDMSIYEEEYANFAIANVRDFVNGDKPIISYTPRGSAMITHWMPMEEI